MGTFNSMFQPGEGYSELDRREIIAQENRSGTTALWIVVVILVLGMGASAYFGYSVWKKQNVQFTQLGQLLGGQGTISSLGQRVDTAETKLHELNGGWIGVGQRLTNLESRVEGNLRLSRKYAETLTQQLHQQISAELDERTSVLDTRLRQVESEQTAQRSQMAQVEADLRQELKQEIGSVRQDTGRDLSGVRQQADANSRDVNTLTHRFDRNRIDFEMTKGQTKELAPGVTLRISGTNPKYQRYRGSLSLAQDHRTLWLRGQSIDEPVRFFHKDGGEPYDLVVTDVTQKAAIGYLLISSPSDTEDSGQRAAVDTSDQQ